MYYYTEYIWKPSKLYIEWSGLYYLYYFCPPMEYNWELVYIITRKSMSSFIIVYIFIPMNISFSRNQPFNQIELNKSSIKFDGKCHITAFFALMLKKSWFLPENYNGNGTKI